MTDSEQSEAPKTLAELLLENKLLSQAQIELAINDQEINDIPLDEILLVRGWITQEKLYEVAPWLIPGSKLPPPPVSRSGSFSKAGTAKTAAFAKSDAGGKPGSAAPASATGASNKPDLSKPATVKPNSSAPAAAKPADRPPDPATERFSTTVQPESPQAAVASSSDKSDKQTEAASSSGSTSGDDLNKSQEIPLVAGTTTGGANKLTSSAGDAKEPPATASGIPEVHVSPIKFDSEQNLKAYKEVLKKILAVDKE